MRPEVEQELAHTLLVELLAYQFASPVRWIETQDIFLAEKTAERIIEIGPADTLSVMAIRTLASKYEAFDAAKSVQRQILCYSKDIKEIYYDVDPIEEEPKPAPAAASFSRSALAAAAPAPVAAAAPVASGGPATQVPDAPVSAIDVTRALIAYKMKKSFLEIPLSKAIRDLVGGKSTLQNEILGDLQKEFGTAPENSQDIPLDELGTAMQATFDGKLGKCSQGLIARLISSKMPGGFNVTSARKHLETKWGLASGRQDGVLLLGISVEPAARLGSEAEAKAFLDDIVQKYAANAGISLSMTAASDGGVGGGGKMMDPAAIDRLTKEQRALFKQQLELLARYLKLDLSAGEKAFNTEQKSSQALQAQLDLWTAEHGDFYATGIEPAFSALKARTYDSSWNWARQDALTMYFDIISGKLKMVDRETVSQCIRLMGKSNPTLLEFMQYHIDHCPTERGHTYKLAKELATQLLEKCKDALTVNPVYKDVNIPTAPRTTIDLKGNLHFEEIERPNCRKLETYVRQMAEGGKISEYGNRTSVQTDLARIYKMIKAQSKMSKGSQLEIKTLYSDVIRSLNVNEAHILKETTSRSSLAEKAAESRGKRESIPFLHLKQKSQNGWDYSKKLSNIYLETMENAAVNGISYAGKYALMTGAGADSIGAEVLQGLIQGGAHVLVTTSRFSRQVTEYYQAMYACYGSRGSQVVVVPFNQGSKQDVEALIDYIYDTKNGLGWDLDYIIPFAAIPENGRQIDGIDSKSELAHRIMLTNLLRMLGAVKTQKANRGIETRPAQVMLPLSPNHGTFGSDGLYSESKLALETLFNRWHAEDWGQYLTICGALIGWTRGTGLMSANNILAEGFEKIGIRTFSQQEMAFNLLGLMSPPIVDLCQGEPVMADLNGGLQFIPDLNKVMTKLRKEITERSDIRRAVSKENAAEHAIINGPNSEALHKSHVIEPRANIKFDFPPLPDWKREIAPLNETLKDMVDLEKVVVLTGFAEVGPWGNARTRWEMEAYGQFSLEGCVEMAWIMGLIKNHNGHIKGKPYSGWVDAKTGEPVDDKDMKAKYESQILEHSGIRLIESELFGGYDPNKKQLLHEVIIEEDLDPFETSKEVAEEFKREHSNNVEIFEIPESGQYTVRMKKGAALWIPKALRFDRLVAGQIPTGWDARRYGVPDEIISQVDRVTLFVLVSTAEALISAGITDPYEFYKYIHVSEVGNMIGSGVGGAKALRGMHRDRYLDKPLQNDILQESFINTMAAWVNMLLLSSSGPIKTPVGACGTAVQSLDIGYETIMDGKARVCIVGGFDDFSEEGSYEFANMGATSNTDVEFAHGRDPQEMSRPTTSTRNGFMESQGCGVQIIMTAKLALDMGVPIYGILALATTASDKIGRSVPAPGQGILTTARENAGNYPSPLLDIKYRKRQIKLRKKQIKQWTASELEFLTEEVEAIKSQGQEFDEKAYTTDRVQLIHKEAERQEKEVLRSFGNDFWKQDTTIAPLRGALATWGLTIDDLGVASFHGTSTKANDKNESSVICQQLEHLGRSKGNAVLGIFQKYLTGHPKGAAGAWMMNGCLQVLNTGLVPGNRNADNVDEVMEKFDYIVYPRRSIQTDGIKAFSVTSFGFGQVGAQAIGVHSKYLFATLDEATYRSYATRLEARQKKSYRFFHDGLINNSLFIAKLHPPYTEEQLSSVLLNPDARISQDKKSAELTYPTNFMALSKKSVTEKSKNTYETVQQLRSQLQTPNSSVGVDIEDIASINIDNETFIVRNFTAKEIAYCRKSASPRSSFAGKWSAKEAVFKSLNVPSLGGGAALIDIEVLNDENGASTVHLHGKAAEATKKAGVKDVSVLISCADNQSIAIALAKF